MATLAPTARDVEQLWTLARLLVNENQVAAATQCLQLCVAAPPSTEIALEANVLLAECCLALCQSEPKESHRGRWWKRYNCAEQCIRTANDAAGAGIPRVWGARLFKCKYNLARFAKTDVMTKHRQVLQSLCEGVRWCCETIGRDSECDAFRQYFLSELRLSLVKMHASTLRVAGQSSLSAFEENLKLVRTSMPSVVDMTFQTWLIQVSCHVLVMSPRFRTVKDATVALEFADKWLSEQLSVSQLMKQYHLILKCFLQLRTGQTKNMASFVDELKALRGMREGTSVVDEFGDEPILDNIVDALDLEVTSRTDCNLGITLSMKAIHSVQANMQVYAAGSDIHVFLTGLLFDMLYTHCELQRQQCRFYEMGVSIAQLLKLFVAYRHHLELTSMAPFYFAQIHTLIAKYSFAIGRPREGEAHVQLAVRNFISSIRPDDGAYPLHFVRVWVDLLDAAMHCSSAADATLVGAIEGHTNGIRVIQVCPTVPQLNLAAEILQTPNLRAVVNVCGNVELRAKYDLFLCKWLWATQELNSGGRSRGLHRHEALEAVRPDMQRLLHESLERLIGHTKNGEAMSEIMALYGCILIEGGRHDNGESTLKDALRISIHAKNVLLQARLLVDVFRVYSHRQLIQVKATTAEKYVKKIQQLHRRITQAQAEQSTISTILAWSSQS